MARRKAAGTEVKATRTVPRARKIASPASAARPSEEQIRERAYLRYLERGGVPGQADADWLAAEAELLGQHS